MTERLPAGFLLLSIVAFLLFASPPVKGTTVAPPSDLGQLARISKSVTFAEAVESWVEEGETIPCTVTRFQRLEKIAGAETGDLFEVREPGGRGKSRAAAVAGSPQFQPGHRYLLFLDAAPGNRWSAKTMAYGLLEEQGAGSDLLAPLAEAGKIELRLLPRKDGKAPEAIAVYHQAALLAHLREVARGAAWEPQQVVAAAAPLQIAAKALQNLPTSCVYLTDGNDGQGMRWFGFENGSKTVSIVATTPGQTGVSDGGVAAVQQGMAAWTNDPNTVIRYSYAGTRARSVTCSANFDYDEGAVIFNDPCSDIADLSGCNGTLAFGGSLYDPNTLTPYDGQGWHPILSTFAVVNNGTQCVGETGFKEVLTHELGHTLGFGHHNPPNPADATMSAFLKNDGRGASLATVDRRCADFDYHTFLDVPFSYWAWRWIEGIENAGVSTTCSPGNYCPGNAMTRAEMAIFLLRAREGGSYTPPACTTAMFSDVPCSSSYAPWINELVRRGVTAGCGSGNYCPGNSVTRAQMAVFLLATLQGPGWSPPACTTPAFSDVPCSSSFAPWINELVRRGVTAGCGSGNYCPNNTVSRDQMAVFVATNFSLAVPTIP